MKTGIHFIAVLCLGTTIGHAELLNLRHEWAASPAGPFTAIPADRIRVNPDGTASLLTDGPRGFFRLQFDSSASGGSVPVMPLSEVPASTLLHVRRFVDSMSKDGSPRSAADWTGVKFSPFVIPLTSAGNLTGTPDMVEIKVIFEGVPPEPVRLFPDKEGKPLSRHRGFILTSLTRQGAPIAGYATRGVTPCEELLERCRGPVYSLRRFGPMFLAAEDSQHNLLGHTGLYPALYPDDAYENHSQPVDYTWDSDERVNPPLPPAPPRAEPLVFTKYGDLLTMYNSSQFLSRRRQQLARMHEFDWLTLEGKAPTLDLKTGEHKPFLPGEQFTHVWLDTEEDTVRTPAVTLGGVAGGIGVTGNDPGAWRLTLRNADRELVRYIIQVRPSSGARGAGSTGLSIKTSEWKAGEESGQPQYDQRPDLNRWCDTVGCGPVMLALQTAWCERNQEVPSAYWNRATGISLTSRRASLRNINSPLVYVEGSGDSTGMLSWYDHFHDACDVACWADGSGSTLPWDAGSALINYTSNLCSPQFPLMVAQDAPNPLVAGSASWTTDIDGDDWDVSGTRVANAIKAGRPGGVYYMEHWHYCMAWRYIRTTVEAKVNGEIIWRNTSRFFAVNAGAGDLELVWNAYDIDGSYLLNLRQLRLPPP